ncbi:MAG TPA: hypothetical protein PKX93_00540 [bacterium]|nr:hypothetical protein [bacterium]
MKAGLWEEDITPWVGTERPGGYGKSYNREVHDPIKVRALVLDDGRKKAVLVGLDLLVVPAKIVSLVRQRVKARLDIPGEALLLAASHTHNSGPVFGLYPEEYADAPELIRELIVNHSTIPDPDYTTLVIEKIVSAVWRSHQNLQDVSLSFWRGQESSCVFNRRFRMRNGRTYTQPGKGNPEIVKPAGPVDPDVNVIGVWTGEGKLLGCLVNYACHGTTGPGGVSADWIFYLEKTIQAVMGSDCRVVFLNGACGDITQVDNLNQGEVEYGEKYSRRLGQCVAAEALKGLVYPTTDVAEIDYRTSTVIIARRKPSSARVEQSLRLIKREKPHSSADWTFAKELLLADYLTRRQPEAAVEIQVIKVGPAVFVANPAEFFCRLGLEIKKGSHFPYTFVVELANGAIGYVPDRAAFRPSGGGYETVLTSYSNLIPEAGEIIVRESLSLLKQLKPDPSPVPRRDNQTSSPWDYGVRGPDLK